MSTSLAQQLQRLAVPQTSQLKRDKKRPSLLFDPKEAAGFKREFIYQLGLDGLEELIAKNQCFEKYRDTLFHTTSKTVERAMQTAEDNKILDRTIRKFLLLCSPYFLLTSTHKALEWLVNRYSIHEYNREDLLMLAMPYHESNIFVKVVQLLKFKDTNDNWYFLKSLQKSGVHLTKQTFLKHCDVAMLKFTTKFMHALVKEHDKPGLLMVPFNFYCTVFLACIERSKQVNEAEVTQMLPALLKGLNSDIGDYCAASYVILARLATKIELTDKLLDKFADKVTQFSVDGLKTEAVLVLIAMHEHQKQYRRIQLEACDRLVEQAWLPKCLQELNEDKFYTWTFVGRFVKSIIKYGLKTDKEVYRKFMTSLLSAIKMDEEFVGSFLLAVLDSYKLKKKYPDHLKRWISEVIATVERQYPEQFDKEVYKILSTTQASFTDRRRKETLQGLMRQTMTLKGKFDVFDKLYHPNEQYRSEAVKYVTEHFASLRQGEKEMIRSSLVDRLDDEELSVVKETLTLIKKTSILDRVTCRDVLIRLSKKCQTEWRQISVDVLKMLISNSDADDCNVLLALVPYLLPNCDADLKRAVQILKFVTNPLLEDVKATKTCSQFCKSVFDALEKNASLELVQDFVHVLSNRQQTCDVLDKYLAALILSLILPKNSGVSIGSSMVDLLMSYMESSRRVRNEKTGSFQFGIETARDGKFPLDSFLRALCNVAVKIEKPADNLGLYDFAYGNDFCRFFITTAKILFKHSEEYTQKFLTHFCDDSKAKIEFILNMAVSNEADHDFQKDCLKELLKVERDGISPGTDQAVVPLILALLQSNDRDVRETTLGLVKTLVEIETEGETYKLLLDRILDNHDAIALDEDQLALVMFNSSTKYKKGTKNAKEISRLIEVLVETICDSKTPISLKAGLLKALTFINSEQILERTAKMALDLLNDGSLVAGMKPSVFVKVICKFEVGVARSLKLDSEAWKLLEKALRSDATQLDNTWPAVVLLKQLDKDFVMKLTNEVQRKLLDVMIETASFSQNPEVSPAISSIFKHLHLDANFVLHHLTEMRDIYLHNPNVKRRKTIKNTVEPTEGVVETVEWKKGITLLELVQEKKNVKNMEVLVPVVFEVLQKCLNFTDQGLVEYPKQLILSFILHCCDKIDPKDLPENAFNVESIVNCIRGFQNPQTHHHALLVLARAATFVPMQVLHHVTAIFTFMGSSVLRHDDSYSFQVIRKIIDTLLPILVQDGGMFQIVKVLQVFVDILLDVPEHRRMPLFEQTLNQIGAEANLHIFLLLVFNAHIHDKTKTKSEKRLEFTSALCRQFAPEVVIKASSNCIKYLKDLPDEAIDEDDEMDPEVFSIKFDTYHSLKHFKYVLVKFLSEFLSSREFVETIAGLKDAEAVKLEELFKDTIVDILKLIRKISRIAEKHKGTPQAKYWTHLLHLSYAILNNTNALLTPVQFLLVVKALMSHDLNVIRRLSLELLSSKLQHNSKYFEDCDDSQMGSLIHPLTNVIGNISDELDADQEGAILAAMHSLELLSKHIASKYPEKFVTILDFIVAVIKSKKSKDKILASAVQCLAELCVNLREYALNSVYVFTPALLKILERNRSQQFPTRPISSTITALERILDTLALFLLPYLEDMLFYISYFTAKWEHEDNPTISKKLQNIQKKIASVVPARVLIPIVQKTYATMIEQRLFKSIAPLMNVLSDNLSKSNGADLNSLLEELTELFLTMLEFRSNHETTLAEANEVENQIIKPLTVMILKLPEGRFRTLYYKIYDWAMQSSKKDRVITFYAFSSLLAEKIQSLFALFAGHIVKNAAELLDACNSTKTDRLYFADDKQKTDLLLRTVLKTLLHLFKHDNQKFVDKTRFNLLMQPLVDQLENCGLKGLTERNEELVTPCIVHFTVAVGDDSLWKQSNYQILLKMRNGSAEVRLVALHCLTEVAQKLGEDFLPLLAETIPYLAELLEDEEEHVEKACRSAVQQMGNAIGEPLQKYF